MSDLAVTQRWMLDVITDPDGLDAGLAHAADGSRRTLGVDAVVHGSQGLGARERLALYSRAYHRRLADCLRESYPGLRHALGHELFDDFAQEYLRAQLHAGVAWGALAGAS
jgi:hypothetical protein